MQKVLVDYEPANEDPILAAQYLAAVVGSIVATANIPKDKQDDILKQLLDFVKYVYDQQTQASAPAKQDNQPSEAFGKWKPK